MRITKHTWRKYAIVCATVLFVTAFCLAVLVMKGLYDLGFRQGAVGAIIALVTK